MEAKKVVYLEVKPWGSFHIEACQEMGEKAFAEAHAHLSQEAVKEIWKKLAKK